MTSRLDDFDSQTGELGVLDWRTLISRLDDVDLYTAGSRLFTLAVCCLQVDIVSNSLEDWSWSSFLPKDSDG